MSLSICISLTFESTAPVCRSSSRSLSLSSCVELRCLRSRSSLSLAVPLAIYVAIALPRSVARLMYYAGRSRAAFRADSQLVSCPSIASAASATSAVPALASIALCVRRPLPSLCTSPCSDFYFILFASSLRQPHHRCSFASSFACVSH